MSSIHSYVRKANGHPKGVVLAFKVGPNKVNISWAMCNAKDTFDKKRGQIIASGRAQKGVYPPVHPNDVPAFKETVNLIVEKAVKYFKPENGAEKVEINVVLPE